MTESAREEVAFWRDVLSTDLRAEVELHYRVTGLLSPDGAYEFWLDGKGRARLENRWGNEVRRWRGRVVNEVCEELWDRLDLANFPAVVLWTEPLVPGVGVAHIALVSGKKRSAIQIEMRQYNGDAVCERLVRILESLVSQLSQRQIKYARDGLAPCVLDIERGEDSRGVP